MRSKEAPTLRATLRTPGSLMDPASACFPVHSFNLLVRSTRLPREVHKAFAYHAWEGQYLSSAQPAAQCTAAWFPDYLAAIGAALQHHLPTSRPNACSMYGLHTGAAGPLQRAR